MKFRIAVQSIICGKYKHEHNIMCEADDVSIIGDKSFDALFTEIMNVKGISIRIAIQSIVDGKYKHEANLMCKTNDILLISKKLRNKLKDEISKREQLLLEYLCSNKKDFVSTQMDSDIIDWDAKGKDISKREYLENEMDWRID